MRELVEQHIQDHQRVVAKLAALAPGIASWGQRVATALAAGRRVFLCGNGGSAADAQHIAAELVGRFVGDRRSLPAIALTTDTSALTAIANDYGYEAVFSRQLEGLAQPGDVLIAISTSGNSGNVLAAARTGRSMGVEVLGLLGGSGGELLEACDDSLVVPSTTTARIQECHIMIGHMLCDVVETALELKPVE
ncbi:MAG: SIS domain-containing protein [Halieaceae bacterium]|nr:SIS domain-containing protein [Halieaceae bacterium]